MAIGAILCFSVPPKESGKERLQIRSCDGILPGTEPSPGEWMDAGALVWVRGLASCFLELCRCAGTHYILQPLPLKQWQMLWDVTSHRGHSKPGVMVKAIERLQQAEDCGAGSCCECGGAFCYVQGASTCFLGLLCGSLFLIPKLSVHCFSPPVPRPIFTSKCNLT